MSFGKGISLGREVRWAVIAIGLVLTALLAGCTSPPRGVAAETEPFFDAVYTHAEGVAESEIDSRKAQDVAVFEWAAELGVAELISYSQLEQEYAQALAARSSGQATGTDVYGARTMALWDFYLEQVEHRVQLIKTDISASLSMDDVREYYDQHQDDFKRQATITVKLTNWDDGKARSSQEVVIDETSVRMLQEADDAPISAALDLLPGESTTVQRDDGSYAQLECLSRVENGFEPFDSVVQAAASQVAAQRFTSGLKQRVGAVS